MLEKVRDLRLEEATETALTLKWDPVKVVSTQTYRLEIRLAAGAQFCFVNSFLPAASGMVLRCLTSIIFHFLGTFTPIFPS